MRKKKHGKRLVVGMTVAMAVGLPGTSAALNLSDDIVALSLEELANLEISSVSRKPESLATAAASLFVITADDIRRSGATTLPAALRLAPNLQVVRVNATTWAISARGFNAPSANKLLVLVDGRPIYTPLHAGVLWDTHDLFMPDVERIEVLSGPNAAAWGSNAVNGVINIVTRSANDTTGSRVAIGAGGFEQDIGARIGGGTAGGTAYRVYGKHYATESSEDAAGNEYGDGLERAQAGFRVDMDAFNGGLTVQGDLYDGELYTDSPSALEIAGANLLAHWQAETDAGATVSVTGYHDRSSRLALDTRLEENLDITGLNFTHQPARAGAHALIWGVDLKHARDDITNAPPVGFLPAQRDLTWASLFLQDEIHLGDTVSLTIGARAEDNTYTGLEFMPNLRVAWSPTTTQTAWAAVSRAVRTPSRLDHDVYAPLEPPFLIAGGEDFDSELADVIELGWRAQPLDTVSLSVTAFHHDYDRLRTLEVNADGAFVFRNEMYGSIAGVEGWFNWEPVPSWRLGGGFLVLDKELSLRPGSVASTSVEGNDADYQLKLRSSHDLPGNTTLDLMVRHLDDRPEPSLPAHTVVDVNFTWHAAPQFDVALRVDNLLDDAYVGYDAGTQRSEFGRQAFLLLTWMHE